MYDLSRKSSFELESLFAFEGIGATIYSGAWPNTTHVWTAYVLGENKTAKCAFLLQKLVKLTDLVPSDRICWDTRFVLFKLWGLRYFGMPSVIPGGLIMHFKAKIQKRYSEKGSLGSVKTVFDVLRENGLVYEFLTPSVRTEAYAMKSLCKRMENNTLPNLTLIHLPSLDGLGHKHGPFSSEMKSAIEKTDSAVRQVLDACQHYSDNVHLLIFSDHGMSPVRQYLDVWEVLAGLPIELLKDYIVFLDSTMARFWFFTSKARDYVEQAFSDVKCGHILDDGRLKQLHLDKVGQEYGEMVFAVDDGVSIYPDFFRRRARAPKGMHGFVLAQDNPILLIHSPKIYKRLKSKKRARMIDIMPTVLDLLSLEAPETCEGTSLIG